MINETYFRVYQSRTDYEDANGNLRNGKRWIVKDADDDRLTTKDTRKAAVEHIKGNFGKDADIRFE